ncbi:MAG: hypothetical protein IJ654_10330 [Bacteroidales bacterium]|nr:hypothetical protein [Bacteroidales bacterium]
MKKTGLQILSEIRETLGVINGKIAEVELQLAELEGFMDFEAPAPELVPEPEPVPVPDPVATPEPVSVPEPVSAEEPAPVPVPEPVVIGDPGVLEEPVAAVEEIIDITAPDLDGDLPDLLLDEAPKDGPILAEVTPAASINDAEATRPKPAVIDVMADKCAWRTDIPGSPVRNIISGISLNDRILFINTLFKGDAQAFQATVALFNTYESLSQAEDFIRSNYPGWDLNSEVVYRFMMAVRRKLNK